MVDFVGLLKRTIDAQSNASSALRGRIYARTRETVEKQMADKNLPADIAALQRRILAKAINEVEDFYLEAETRRPAEREADKQAGVREASKYPPPSAGGAFIAPQGRGFTERQAEQSSANIFADLQKKAGIKPISAADAGQIAHPQGDILPQIGRYGAPSRGETDERDFAAAPMPPAEAGNSPPIYGAHLRQAETPPPNAYFARAQNAASARSQAASSRPAAGREAQGGDYRRAENRPAFAAAPKNARQEGGFISFDEEKSAAPKNQSAERETYAAGAYSYSGGDVFARRPLDAPVPALLDEIADNAAESFAADYPPSAYGAAAPGGNAARTGAAQTEAANPAARRRAAANPYELPSAAGEVARPPASPYFAASSPYGNPRETAGESAPRSAAPQTSRASYENPVGAAPLPAAPSSFPVGAAPLPASYDGDDDDDNRGNADGNFAGGFGPYGDSASEPAAGGGREAPLSPYNIGAGNFTDGEDSAAENAPPAYQRGFSTLHNFLFGDAPAAEEDNPPSLYPAADESRQMPPANAAQAERQSENRQDISAAKAENPSEPMPLSSMGNRAGAEAGFSPIPDFLLDNDGGEELTAADNRRPAAEDKYNLPNIGEADSQDFSPEPASANSAANAAEKPSDAQSRNADIMALPDDFLNFDPETDADVLLPEARNEGEQTSGQNAEAGDINAGSRVVSDIFAQAAIREKRRSGKRRLLFGGIIILALLAFFGGIIWFLADFPRNDRHPIASLVEKTQETQPETAEKTNQRLMGDGQEVTIPPPAPAAIPQAAPAEQTPPAADDIAAESADNIASTGDVAFQEARTALMPATAAQGKVNWSLVHEKTPEGREDTALRGEISIPERDIIARFTLRPNHDATIPAVYLAEFMFMVPENFEGVAIDKISPLMFKANGAATGQELLDTRLYKINDNFFVVTLNAPEPGRNPRLQRNIALMEQLPWLTMNLAYKNGRIAELNFAKGDKGNALFKAFFDAQPPAGRGIAVPAAAPSAAQ